jgi:hypothetical protein
MIKTGNAASTDRPPLVTAEVGLRLPLGQVDAVVFDLEMVLSNGDAQAHAHPDALRLILSLRKMAVPVAVVTDRRDGRERLVAAKLDKLLAAVVGGDDVERARLPGPPDPAVLLHTTGLLDVHPARVAVFQDRADGVQASCRGGFGLAVGVDRAGGCEDNLRAYGAQWVLTDLDGVRVDEEAARPQWWQPGLAPAPSGELGGWILDYCGVDPQVERVRETLCTVGNGHFASRGARHRRRAPADRTIRAPTRPACSTGW